MNQELRSALRLHQQDLMQRPLLDYANAAALSWLRVAGIEVDFSRNYLNAETLRLWQRWWQSVDLQTQLEALRAGQNVNVSEQRPALHHLLRQPEPEQHRQAIQNMRQQLQSVAERWRAQGVRDVVHLGIGGSELGMRLLCEALHSRQKKQIRIHFLSSPDPERIFELQDDLNPRTTALIIASKSFHTEEILFTARKMYDWLSASKPHAIITANVEAAREFSTTAEIIPLWHWVGGRFSLSSALALPLILQNDFSDYEALLQGMAAVDAHFFDTPAPRNIPILLATLDAWYNHYFAYPARAIITYAHALRTFPAYLQQLVMESLGKNCNQQGEALRQRSGMMIWGGGGTDTQHSFFQWLHQGSQIVPLDMITLKRFSHIPHDNEAQTLLHSHYIAQMSALLSGQAHAEPYQRSAGNRPSTALILEALTPQTLGALCALYEHKTSVEALLYDINAYDQWGVEYGKKIAAESRKALLNAENQLDAAGKRLSDILKTD